MKYDVIRAHEGDKNYEVGDVREANEGEVAHLVPHVLRPLKKAAKPLKNKAVK